MATLQSTLKGLLYIVGGTVLLLYTLDIMKQSLTYVLIAASIIMILYGILKSGIADRVLQIIEQYRSKSLDKAKSEKSTKDN